MWTGRCGEDKSGLNSDCRLLGYDAVCTGGNTGLFISLSGTSELDCATTKTDTAERSISIGRESPKVFFCTRVLGVLADSTVYVTKNGFHSE